MLKGKQRAYLRSIANTLKPSTQIGKDGVTESFRAIRWYVKKKRNS